MSLPREIWGRLARLGVAVIVLISLAATALVLRNNFSDEYKRLTQRIEAIEWKVSQTIFEAQRLEMALLSFSHNALSQRQLAVPFEIFWSRIDVLRQSELLGNQDLIGELDAIENYLIEIEDEIYGAEDLTVRLANVIQEEVADWAANIRQTWLAKREQNRAIVLAAIGADNQRKLALLELSVFLCFALLAVYLFAELFFANRAYSREKQLKEQANDAYEAMSSFLANVSHEIRTPLNAIAGMVQLLSASSLGPDQRDHVQVAGDAADTLLATVNDVLDLSRIQAGRMPLRTELFELLPELERLMGIHRHAAEEKGLNLSISVTPEVPKVIKVDRFRLEQVLNNLVANAVKFTQAGEVSLAFSVRNRTDAKHELHFSVRDTGVGIPENSLDIVFKPFSQIDNGFSREHGGTGLGLSISRELCQLLGGDLKVASRLGEGSNFHGWVVVEEGHLSEIRSVSVTERVEPAEQLPRRDSDVVDSYQKSSETSPKPTCGKRALVVDDSATNRLVLKRFLQDEFDEIIEAESGLRAIEEFEAQHFDTILMDIQMPGMDGIETTRRIRSQHESGNGVRVPIIAVTANVMEHQVSEYMKNGIDDIVAKPVKKATLLSTIGKNLSGVAPMGAD